MSNSYRIKLSLLLSLVLVVLLAALGYAEIPWEPAKAHEYADQVLQPRFVAAMNEWTHRHPKDQPGHEWEHCKHLDVRDVARWQKVREAFRDLDRAYQRAGY